ncbi:hypothetical protein EFS21_09450 [Levilactobacillus brevis]|uniref:Uncharacterized protein n=1 Tax=Levilactobacillus brevis (strain ATCC 367 / BCRC 12310 / CIP 105137 / JCM 1170 / LMG 11437 / NCIMB 947 / NCTC 947) TaxID=387344 RepID=Q03RH4_LEVBA|nr:hypothetical protein [Levilactobacillus brevis]ABJ64198.1 hypothetical protein LVIS_1065 [Levilactobacillus brevis ATCC 367]KWT47436.1 hypothetical protein ABB39_08415 [Levilactobacillus brevis]KWU40946.1 hypothetical protein AV935_00830 [Levilactobacillus brevis]MCT3582082.1 hypothetical protein [Levilactobacillus brevis]MCT3590817.1 hypothetical protein [Levilactobacillus brevis]
MWREISKALSANNLVTIHVVGGDSFTIERAGLNTDTQMIMARDQADRVYIADPHQVTFIEVTHQ